MNTPSLTERGVKYWLNETLKISKANKKDALSNQITFYSCIFFVALFIFLFWNKKNKSLSKEDKERKAAADRRIILEKLNRYAALRRDNGLITNLPLPSDRS